MTLQFYDSVPSAVLQSIFSATSQTSFPINTGAHQHTQTLLPLYHRRAQITGKSHRKELDKWSICWREVSLRGFALQYCIHCYSPKLSPTCAFPLVQMRGVVLFSKDFAMGLCPQGWCWGAGRSGMAISYGVEVAHPGSALHTPVPSIPRLCPNKGCSDPGCRFGENKISPWLAAGAVSSGGCADSDLPFPSLSKCTACSCHLGDGGGKVKH